MDGLRNLSGVYFRAKRFGKFENVCFEELTEAEQDERLASATPEFARNLAKQLAATINKIGSELDIVSQ